MANDAHTFLLLDANANRNPRRELRELMGRLYNCVTAQFPSQGSMAVGTLSALSLSLSRSRHARHSSLLLSTHHYPYGISRWLYLFEILLPSRCVTAAILLDR